MKLGSDVDFASLLHPQLILK